jgi:uncharacterized membrane protein YfcA
MCAGSSTAGGGARAPSYDVAVTRAVPPVATLVGIGLAGGFFGALFGVGGGIVVVPLLVLLVGLTTREATATSLAAIGFTAVFGVVVFAALGHVVWRDAALVGLPAMAGTLLGTWTQHHLSSRRLTILFAVFLVAVAVRLLA